jgi:hypothetical protein
MWSIVLLLDPLDARGAADRGPGSLLSKTWMQTFKKKWLEMHAFMLTLPCPSVFRALVAGETHRAGRVGSGGGSLATPLAAIHNGARIAHRMSKESSLSGGELRESIRSLIRAFPSRAKAIFFRRLQGCE